MAININSEAACRKAYINYHCYKNSMGISAEEMGQITQAWSNKISSWQASVSSDDNEYEFDDSEYANYKSDGKDAAKESTNGHERNLGDNVKSYGSATLNALQFIGQTKNLISLLKKGTKSFTVGWVASAAAAANVALYWAIRPNKESKEACDELQTQMSASQVTLEETQAEMETMSEKIITLSDEATAYNEEANENIEEQKTEYDMYYQSLTVLKDKITLGTPLTSSEKELYKEVIVCLNETGGKIEKVSNDATDTVSDIYDELGEYQEGYDVAAETMGQIEGLTDYASDFDKEAQTASYILGATLTANSVMSGAVAAKLLCDPNIFTKAVSAVFAGVSLGASISNGFAAKEQFQWAGEIGTEISSRELTQKTNEETNTTYESEIDAYAGWMQGVEDLELEIPDDIEPVEDTGFPTTEPTGENAVPETLKPKQKEDENKKLA